MSERIKIGIEKAKKDWKTRGYRGGKMAVEIYKNRNNIIEFITKSNEISTITIYNVEKRHKLKNKSNLYTINCCLIKRIHI